MFKKITIYSLIILFSLTLFSLPVLAEETDGISNEEVSVEELNIEEPGIVSWFKNTIDSFQLLITRDPIKRSEIELRKASRQIVKAREIVKDNPDDENLQDKLNKIDDKYKESIERINNRIEEFNQENEDSLELKSFLDKYTSQQLLHQEVLMKLEGNVPEMVMEQVKENRQEHLQNFGEVMNKLQNKEEFKEQLQQGIENKEENTERRINHMEMIEELGEISAPEVRERVMEIKQEKNEVFQELRSKQQEIKNTRYFLCSQRFL